MLFPTSGNPPSQVVPGTLLLAATPRPSPALKKNISTDDINNSSWWLNQPSWKIWSKWVHLPPIFRVKIKNSWNHQLDNIISKLCRLKMQPNQNISQNENMSIEFSPYKKHDEKKIAGFLEKKSSLKLKIAPEKCGRLLSFWGVLVSCSRAFTVSFRGVQSLSVSCPFWNRDPGRKMFEARPSSWLVEETGHANSGRDSYIKI